MSTVTLINLMFLGATIQNILFGYMFLVSNKGLKSTACLAGCNSILETKIVKKHVRKNNIGLNLVVVLQLAMTLGYLYILLYSAQVAQLG